jgi:lysophospholipase L1-like esterase
MKTEKLILVILLSFFFTESSIAQDWANLTRFKQENSELKSSGKVKDRIVFMGNSITEGWSSIRPNFFANNSFVNRGISGQTTPQMLLRFRQDVINLKPSAVVILAGINDIAGNTGPMSIEVIAENIFSMAELARAHNIEVVLCSVLPAADFSWRPGLEPADKVIKLNKLISRYAKEQNLIYVDYYNSMVNDSKGLKETLGNDGVHPNARGYEIMESLLETALLKI